MTRTPILIPAPNDSARDVQVSFDNAQRQLLRKSIHQAEAPIGCAAHDPTRSQAIAGVLGNDAAVPANARAIGPTTPAVPNSLEPLGQFSSRLEAVSHVLPARVKSGRLSTEFPSHGGPDRPQATVREALNPRNSKGSLSS